ncbi:phage tail protein I [Mergibacter septicus]|uniref:Phage tail protein I n=1 Tax=Mergibacter septicus TaxID=221402 RepID=A0A8D4LN59_9PAST|nr:phage tail protein I [Mergibacter septicus]AWX15243.1 phage tail protein I [Mergibacter septicus]QDJ14497.1 phage tail protein I [Mergibacter septicus]UTU48068.1 phage tail protein I [Mergibacter septicus]WMR96320.1 phage tail protein I [Mergibacter septicus]
MAKLVYPNMIAKDKKFSALADLGLSLYQLKQHQLLTNFIDLMPTEYLFLLAEKWSVIGEDGWDLAESETAKRNLIKQAVELHHYKGTPYAIRQVIRQLGFGEVEIIEGLNNKKYNGEINYSGIFTHNAPTAWASYVVVLRKIITRDQAQQLRQILRYFAPARCQLVALDYRETALRYNATATFNGEFSFGTA